MAKKKKRKLTEEKKQAIERKHKAFNPFYNADDMDSEGRPWWWNKTITTKDENDGHK